MLHSADFTTTILTICSIKKWKKERENILLRSAVNVCNRSRFQKKPACRENKMLHFNFFTGFNETEIQAVVRLDQICIFVVAVLFLRMFIARSLSSQGFI